MFTTPNLMAMAIKAGHRQFDQYFISEHTGVYLQFQAGDIFNSKTMDRSHDSYRYLQLGRQDIVDRYISNLEGL